MKLTKNDKKALTEIRKELYALMIDEKYKRICPSLYGICDPKKIEKIKGEIEILDEMLYGKNKETLDPTTLKTLKNDWRQKLNLKF